MRWKKRIIHQRNAKFSYIWKFQSISWTFTTQMCKTASGFFQTVAQGFSPSSVHQSVRRNAAAFIHWKILIEKKKSSTTWLPSWILECIDTSTFAVEQVCVKFGWFLTGAKTVWKCCLGNYVTEMNKTSKTKIYIDTPTYSRHLKWAVEYWNFSFE